MSRSWSIETFKNNHKTRADPRLAGVWHHAYAARITRKVDGLYERPVREAVLGGGSSERVALQRAVAEALAKGW
jgi:hypothetical protein